MMNTAFLSYLFVRPYPKSNTFWGAVRPDPYLTHAGLIPESDTAYVCLMHVLYVTQGVDEQRVVIKDERTFGSGFTR